MPKSDGFEKHLLPSPKELRPGIPLTASFDQPQPGMVKIGDAARSLGISVQTLRLYEQEGLVISFKSDRGTRWYSEEDLRWMQRIQELLREGLNFAGIRRLLALLPCWALRPCRPEDHAACSMRLEVRMPCWMSPDKLCTEKLKECYHCNTYRQARNFVNLKQSADIVVKAEAIDG